MHLTANILMLIFALLPAISRGENVESEANTAQQEVQRFLDEVNLRLTDLYNREVFASWQNEINGPQDLVALLQAEIANEEIFKYLRSIWPKVSKYRRFNLSDPQLKRQLVKIPKVGYEALTREELKNFYTAIANMTELYAETTMCNFRNPAECNLKLMPDVQKILQTTSDIQEIEHYWLEWRRKIGQTAKADFEVFTELYRKTAKINGFSRPSDYWFDDIEENSFEAMKLLNKFMLDLRPLFEQLHAYLRFKLRQKYGDTVIPREEPYPQNLAEIFIGNAFRHDAFIELPFPELKAPNITAGLLGRGLDSVHRIFWNVADFFRSLRMPQLESDFWAANAKPKGRKANTNEVCYNKAWAFFGIDRVTLSYCPDITEQHFFDMFEAISDIYYFKAFQSQKPVVFQKESFPNFSDALGKMFSLSASTPTFLEKLKLIPGNAYNSKEARINRLYLQSLRTIFILPVFYVLDRYRVDVLDGRTNLTNNCAYWKLVDIYTGAEPPIQRNNEDFDAAAKLLIDVDEEYTSHIMSTVLQYQLYKHFCELTGQYQRDNASKPLDLCDLYDQREIGPIILNAMSKGSSEHYREILKILTNTTELTMDGVLEYFKPLQDWLMEYNKENNVEVGWEESQKCTT